MTKRELEKYIAARRLERVARVAEGVASLIVGVVAEIRRPPRRAWMIVEGRGFVPR